MKIEKAKPLRGISPIFSALIQKRQNAWFFMKLPKPQLTKRSNIRGISISDWLTPNKRDGCSIGWLGMNYLPSYGKKLREDFLPAASNRLRCVSLWNANEKSRHLSQKNFGPSTDSFRMRAHRSPSRSNRSFIVLTKKKYKNSILDPKNRLPPLSMIFKKHHTRLKKLKKKKPNARRRRRLPPQHCNKAPIKNLGIRASKPWFSPNNFTKASRLEVKVLLVSLHTCERIR